MSRSLLSFWIEMLRSLLYFLVEMSRSFLSFWIETLRSLLSFWIEMLNADAGFLFPLARRLPTPCSSNKRPDNLFLHSLVYWSSLGRPKHLNKSTNTQIQQKHSPVKWSYSFLPIRPRHLQRQSTQKRRKFTNFWKYISTYSPPIFRGQQIVSVSSFWAEKFNSSTSILLSTTFTTL